jgi:hypothetical protein
VAQGEGPEFKPQYCNKTKQNKVSALSFPISLTLSYFWDRVLHFSLDHNPIYACYIARMTGMPYHAQFWVEIGSC